MERKSRKVKNRAKGKECGKREKKNPKRRKADRMKSVHRFALKCWKVFRCVRANRGVKAPFRSILPSGAVFDYIRRREKGWRDLARVGTKGWNIKDFRRIWPTLCSELNRLTLSSCQVVWSRSESTCYMFLANGLEKCVIASIAN